MFVTIHQPYFMPWLGYFSKLAYSSHFVVLDDVSFTKRHYLDRARIVNMHGEAQWISVPVGQNYQIPLNEVSVKDPNENYMKKIIRTIELSYPKAMFFGKEWPDLKILLESEYNKSRNLVDIDVGLIIGIAKHIGLTLPEILRSSELKMDGFSGATGRLEAIFKNFPDKKLLIGEGESRNVHDLDSLSRNNVEIYIQKFFKNHPKYVQLNGKGSDFKPGLSILDCILNVGSVKTIELIKNNDCRPCKYLPSENECFIKETT